jgi:hypothetical protein
LIVWVWEPIAERNRDERCCPAWYRLVKSAELVATPAASTVPASRRTEPVRRIADMRMNS